MTLRDTFDEAPELYDRMRRGYPPELFDDLERLAGLETGSRVLELGPGTGQATAALARRGYEVTAVELGSGLATVARRSWRRSREFGSSTPPSRSGRCRAARSTRSSPPPRSTGSTRPSA